MIMSVLIVNSLLFEIMNLFLFSETSHYFPLMMLISSWSLFWDMPDITIVTIINSAKKPPQKLQNCPNSRYSFSSVVFQVFQDCEIWPKL